jgi:hypothetical protein
MYKYLDELIGKRVTYKHYWSRRGDFDVREGIIESKDFDDHRPEYNCNMWEDYTFFNGKVLIERDGENNSKLYESVHPDDIIKFL